MKYASICLLVFERPSFFDRTIQSLINHKAGFPYELIVSNDGSINPEVQKLVNKYRGHISFIVDNCGQNMGVGAAMHHSCALSHGDYIVKCDSDLDFTDNWLKEAIDILENNPDVGTVGMFNYQKNYAPSDMRFVVEEERDDCYIMTDFVNSIYVFRRETYEKYKHLMGDDGWQQELKNKHKMLTAITKRDVVFNYGFGRENSIYMDKDGKPRKKSSLPKIIGE